MMIQKGKMNNYAFVFAIVVTCSMSQKYKVIDVGSTRFTNLDYYGIPVSDNQLIFELKGCSGGNVGFHDENGNWVYYARFTNTQGVASVLSMEFNSRYQTELDVLLSHSIGCSTFLKLKLTWKNGKFALWSYHMSGWRLVGDESNSLQMDDVKDIRIYNPNTLQWKIYAIEHTSTPHRVSCVNF